MSFVIVGQQNKTNVNWNVELMPAQRTLGPQAPFVEIGNVGDPSTTTHKQRRVEKRKATIADFLFVT